MLCYFMLLLFIEFVRNNFVIIYPLLGLKVYIFLYSRLVLNILIIFVIILASELQLQSFFRFGFHGGEATIFVLAATFSTTS